MAKPALIRDRSGEPAALATRAIARQYLRKVLEEAARLQTVADEDPEAVHDFRVAMRRFRTVLTAFKPWLRDSVSRQSRQRLRQLSGTAGVVRDLQVQRALLLELGGSAAAPPGEDARRIAGRLEREEARKGRVLVRRLFDRLPGVARQLVGELESPKRPLSQATTAGEQALGLGLVRLLSRRLAQGEARVRRLRRTGRLDAAHETRIELKKLRYLLEIFEGSSRLAVTANLRIAALLEELGRLHDAVVLRPRLTGEGALPELRTLLRRHIALNQRRVRGRLRSGDWTVAQKATVRLIRRLELLHRRHS